MNAHKIDLQMLKSNNIIFFVMFQIFYKYILFINYIITQVNQRSLSSGKIEF